MESGEMELLSKQAILSLPRDVEKSLDGKILDEYINVKDIEALPTVQSQSTAGQLNDSAQSTNLIDRQQAIDAIHCNIVVTGRENAELVAKTMGEFVDRIKALPTIQPVATDTNVGDTISRQWLLECINDGWIKFDTDKDANRFIHLVRDIAPTIQPEKRTEKRTETHGVCLDAISRQAAIDVLHGYFDGMLDTDTVCPEDIYGSFECIPSAQPERKKGEWIEISSINHTYKCSECGRLLVNVADGRNNVSKHYPYCHCGAYMGGEQHETD